MVALVVVAEMSQLPTPPLAEPVFLARETMAAMVVPLILAELAAAVAAPAGPV
jgi:hypothetical protein